ncbi:MAG: transcription elongation factor GreA [Thermoleophilaceae bacterium]|jgi:transcription elongation factor GreA|nr:transcription elongation factor GreA [Thermoleophilaceae bacterium]
MTEFNGGEAITAEGMAQLREELERLEGEGRREMAARILAARELGDLKENAEYHIAKDDQAHLETKIKRLTERLRAAVVVEAPTSADKVAFGATVHVVDEDTGKESSYTLVGPTEADIKTGKLSSESPMAQALMGRKAGDKFRLQTPRGHRMMRIDRIG